MAASRASLLLMYATDACKLSSLLIRRILLHQPANFTLFREEAWQLLLDQTRANGATRAASSSVLVTRPNMAAITMLQWGREWNSVQYYGLKEYARRWWNSTSRPATSMTTFVEHSHQRISETNAATDIHCGSHGEKVAKIAFMITSEQRQRLTNELGYTTQDIRQLKPIEALLLLENGVIKENHDPNYDFRLRLKELVEENDRLIEMDYQLRSKQHQQINDVHQEITITETHSFSRSAKLAQMENSNTNIHAKNDLSKIQYLEGGTNGDVSSTQVTVKDGTFTDDENNSSHLKLSSLTDSEQVLGHMMTNGSDDSDESNDNHKPCWYEVVEILPSSPHSLNCNHQREETVIALFSTKKEAYECVRFKQSLGINGGSKLSSHNDIFVRKRGDL